MHEVLGPADRQRRDEPLPVEVEDREVAAGLSVGRPEDLMQARRLLADGVDLRGREDALADESTDLSDLS